MKIVDKRTTAKGTEIRQFGIPIGNFQARRTPIADLRIYIRTPLVVVDLHDPRLEYSDCHYLDARWFDYRPINCELVILD